MNKKTKKLALSSETIRNLNDLADVQGATATGNTCYGTGRCTLCTINCTICTIHCGSACCP